MDVHKNKIVATMDAVHKILALSDSGLVAIISSFEPTGNMVGSNVGAMEGLLVEVVGVINVIDVVDDGNSVNGGDVMEDGSNVGDREGVTDGTDVGVALGTMVGSLVGNSTLNVDGTIVDGTVVDVAVVDGTVVDGRIVDGIGVGLFVVGEVITVGTSDGFDVGRIDGK